MKTFKNVIVFFFALIAFNANAQMNKASTTKLVESKTFTFIPTTMFDQGPAETSLTGFLYYLSVKPDTIITYLPSFGTGGNGPGILNTQTREEYISQKFNYTTTKSKTGIWDINIEFKDIQAPTRIKMRMWIYPNGFATLKVDKPSGISRTYKGHLQVPGERSLSKN